MKRSCDFVEWLLDGGIWWFVGLLIAGLFALLADGIFCKEIQFEGKVIDKFYKAESNQSGTGVGVSSSGKPASGHINTGCIFGLNWGNKLTN